MANGDRWIHGVMEVIIIRLLTVVILSQQQFKFNSRQSTFNSEYDSDIH